MSISQSDRTREAKVARGTPIAESIKLGNLQYPMIRPMSLVSQRRSITHDAQSTSYAPSSTITTFLNSGDDYVYGPGCYLRFDVTFATADGDMGGGANSIGSIVNLIDSLSIYHSSGTLIDRVEAVNLKHAVTQIVSKPADYFLSNGVNYGYDALLTAGTVYKYAIPLSDLHNFWGRKKLIPAMLHSGLKVVIQLASNDMVTSVTTGTFTVTNPSFSIDSLTLTDSAQLFLQEQSAKNGLVFPFTSWEHVSQATAASTTYNLQVFRAVSQATMAMAVARVTTNVADDSKDSFTPTDIAADEKESMSVQWKLAGLYMPVKALDSLADLWQWNRNQITNDPGTVAGYPVTTDEYSGIHLCRLERDHVIKAQGIPVSGSRSLTYTATFNDPTARTISIYMEFIKLAKVYLYDKIIIQE